MQAALQNHWAPVFAEKQFTLSSAEALAQHIRVTLPLKAFKIPGVCTVESLLSRAKNSAPGRAGIPYAAWRAGGRCAATSREEEDHQ